MNELIRKTVKLTKELPYYLSRRWHEVFQPNSKEEYTRFVILSRKRNGSTFLQTSLNSHHAIQCYGELFMGPELTVWNSAGYHIERFNRQAKLLKRKDTGRFMERYVYRSYPQKVKAVGFKLFYIQARDPSIKDVWEYLKQDKSVHIVRLVRENYLASIASKEEAKRSHTWMKLKEEDGKSDADTVTLDPDELDYLFECYDNEDLVLKERFSDHPYHYVTFEDLLTKPDAFQQLQHFLGVEPKNLYPATKKQSHRPLHERITNYSELKAHFKGTKWDRFFKE